MQGVLLIQDLAVILVVAGVAGWICQRIGLSVVVGFLLAGLLVGPYSPLPPWVADSGRIETLAQLGLVFLMFAVGMQLSVRRLRRLGWPLAAATVAATLGVYYLARLLGAALGWTSAESVFLAAMLMISSSAIIGKALQQTAATHERFGHLAMGATMLEDVIGIVLLTLLSSYVQFGGFRAAAAPSLGETVGLLAAFVALACIGGLLLVPWLLRRKSIVSSDELQTIGVAALLFGLAVVAQRAGYSLALGAFLLGTIVSETAHRHQVERTFEGMRDLFTAVFFVTIGLQVDPRALLSEGWLILGVTAFTLTARPFAVTAALTVVGTPLREALRTGLSVTAIGEFSFIFAQLGVGAAVVPPRFYPLAVGVALLTGLVMPLWLRHSERIAGWVLARQPRWLEVWLRYYHGRLERIQARRRRSRLWQISRKRFVQIGVEIAAVSGLLLFADELEAALAARLGRDWLFPNGLDVVFWLVLCLVLLAPVVAIWRNLSALALIFAQALTAGRGRGSRLAPAVEWLLKLAGAVGLYVWLGMLLPTEGTARWLVLTSALAAVVALLLLRQRLIFWHSHLEAELQSVMESAELKSTGSATPWLRPHSAWNLHMLDCVVPDLADVQGRSIAELELRARFGCSVVGIERQGFMIPLPGPGAVLYPRDRVLLLGTMEQVRAGRRFLTQVTGTTFADSVFEEVQMQALVVPEWSRVIGRTLGELAPARTFGVQIAGIHRAAARILNPAAEEVVHAGDELLTLGTAGQITEFRLWLRERPEEESGDAAEAP